MFLVGAIPIAIAAVIAVASWFLLREADRARAGAVLAGGVYRDLLVATAERDRFSMTRPGDRGPSVQRFFQLTDRAGADLEALAATTRSPDQNAAVQHAADNLGRYNDLMRKLVASTERSDRLVSEMVERAAALVSLTDQARTRQHASNADIVASVSEKDQRLRAIRDTVDAAQTLRAAVALAEAKRPRPAAALESFGVADVRNAGGDVQRLLEAAGRKDEAQELDRLLAAYAPPAGSAVPPDSGGAGPLIDWCERLLKVDGSAERALHEEVGQLLTYSIEANETEQATQNIAIAALKLGQRTSDALAARDIAEASAILGESDALGATMARLPISPLIQSEMIEALAQWRDRLATTAQGLSEQKATLLAMDAAAVELTEGARLLNDTFTGDADRLGTTTRTILLVGATIGLLFGTYAALVVARSIVAPLRRVQQSMLHLADNPEAGGVSDADRSDELGDMARAANFFVDEIVARETELRAAVQRADSALTDLRRTQDELIQAEKLASLGQLVAGVAHEINTPVGVALTTATVMEQEAKAFALAAQGGQLLRSQLSEFTERMREGSRLLAVNLARAGDLVHSFKQVAADQVSGERRRIDLKTWLQELVTSLSPVLRKRGISVDIDCPDGLAAETYPGALGQVLTNLVVNAAVHGYGDGDGGVLHLRVTEPDGERIRLRVTDEGRGIPAADLPRIFDPFFTTARQKGSTGLGLHIVYNLVVQTLRGRIKVESAPGQGTTFRIDLPRDLPTQAEPSLAEAAPAGA
ncbi:MAG: HAMP domain-containing sensor histidine kinase [Alsobacter sp.]